MKAEVIVNTKDISHQEWLNFRKQGIGGSDAAAVAGVNPFQSPVEVFLEKTDQISSNKDNEAMRIGRDLEDYVAQRFEEKRSEDTGEEVKAWNVNQMLRHPEHDFMLADIDKRVVGEGALLECKTTVDYKGLWTQEKYPNMYAIQVQHYLAVTGYSKAYLAVLILNRREFRYYEIDRDEEIIDMLIDIEKDFWENNVQQGVPPEVDGTRASSELLKEMHPEAEEGKRKDLSDSGEDIQELIEKRNEYKETEKKFKKERKAIENKIKDKLGDAEIGVVNGEELVKWKNISSTRFDKKSLKEEHPDIYKKFTYESQYRRLYL